MMEYSVYIACETDNSDLELSGRLLSHLLGRNVVADPVTDQDLSEGWVGVQCNVEASDAAEAHDLVLSEVARAGISGRCIEMGIRPYEDPERAELVGQSEIARRLGLSRARVNDLTNREDFPAPVPVAGRRWRSWKWGDVADWQTRRVEALSRRGEYFREIARAMKRAA